MATEETTKSQPDIGRSLLRCALAGGLVWALAVAWAHPSPFEMRWAEMLLLLGPLVLVPLGLRLVLSDHAPGPSAAVQRAVLWTQFPAALLLAGSFLLDQGIAAGVLAGPWMIVTGLIALLGLLRLLEPPRRTIPELTIAAGMIFLVVGGGWTLASRLDIRPLEFEPVIVLLTGIHFHYAGFALPIMTGLACRMQPNGSMGFQPVATSTPRRSMGFQPVIAQAAAIGVVVSVPFVATGITTTQLEMTPLIETAAAWLMSLGGVLAAWLHWRLAIRPERGLPARIPPLVRFLWAVAAVSLAGSMVLAAMYGSRFLFDLEWLDIPWMRATHGTANALGFGLAGMIGWNMWRR